MPACPNWQETGVLEANVGGREGGRIAAGLKGDLKVKTKIRRGIMAVGLSAAMAGVALPATAATNKSNKSQTDVSCTPFNSGNFSSSSTSITNQYFPLPVTTPATTFTYHGVTKGHS